MNKIDNLKISNKQVEKLQQFDQTSITSLFEDLNEVITEIAP